MLFGSMNDNNMVSNIIIKMYKKCDVTNVMVTRTALQNILTIVNTRTIIIIIVKMISKNEVLN